MSRIVVGVDGSEAANQALAWALREARYRDTPLEVLYAVEDLDRIGSALDSPPAVPGDELEGGVHGALDRLVERLGTEGVDVVTSQVTAKAPAALVTASLDAGLVVVGSHGEGGLMDRLLGSVAEHCVSEAHCPVAVIPSGRTASGEVGPADARVVVGVDGSEGSKLALRWAMDEATARGWPLLVVMAWSYLDQHHPGGGEGFDPSYGEGEAEEALDALIEEVRASGNAFEQPMEKAVPCELPQVALIDSVFPQDLLVIGARGHGVLAGKLIGAVSLHCVAEAPCPTVVVRSH